MERKAMTIEEAEKCKDWRKLHPILSEDGANVEIERHPEQIGYRLKITLPEGDVRWANSVQEFKDIWDEFTRRIYESAGQEK